MRILYLLTRDLGPTGTAIRAEHEKTNAVETLDLRVERDYGAIVDKIAAADRVVSW